MIVVLKWMHLSDLHVSGEDWQRDDVLGALVLDLPELLCDRELRPDLLIVTGDVANRGRRSLLLALPPATVSRPCRARGRCRSVTSNSR